MPGPVDSVAKIGNEVLNDTTPRLVKDPEVLDETWIPTNLPHREKEIRDLMHLLAPAYQGDKPSNVIVYGKSGTGKTAVVTSVLQFISQKAPKNKKLGTVIVNCKDASTSYGVLSKLLESQVTDHVGLKLGSHVLLDRITDALRERGGVLVIVLDELDLLLKRSGDDVLYSLLEINRHLQGGKVAVIGVTNDLKLPDSLDSRVRSRLNQEYVMFHPYDQRQLNDILTDRVKAALAPHAMEPEVVAYCGALAAKMHGDARRAVGLVRVGARVARQEGAKTITEKHIQEANAQLELEMVELGVKRLPLHQKFVLWTTLGAFDKRKAPITTGTLYSEYSRLCAASGTSPTSDRRVYDYLLELETMGVISMRIINGGPNGRGRTTHIMPTVPIESTMRVLEESEEMLPKFGPRDSGQRSLDMA